MLPAINKQGDTICSKNLFSTRSVRPLRITRDLFTCCYQGSSATRTGSKITQW